MHRGPDLMNGCGMPYVTLVIRMRAHDGRANELADQCRKLTAEARHEERGVLGLAYGMTGDDLLAVESYEDAAAVQAHLGRAAAIAAHSAEIADLVSIEVVADEHTADELRDVLEPYSPDYVTTAADHHR